MMFKTRIAELLAERQLKQADLCRKTGIPTSLMSNYVKGKASPSLDNAIKIANSLGVTLDYLVGHKTAAVSLSKAQTTLLNDYETLNDEGQYTLRNVLVALKMTHAKNAKKDSGVVQNNTYGNNYSGITDCNFNSKVNIS